MSTAALFSIGAVIFSFTVWGAVMVFSFWLGGLTRGKNREMVVRDGTTSPNEPDPGPAGA